jgi:uncharacterized protein (TIGR03067 family)
LDRLWLRIIKRGDRYQRAFSVDGKEYTILGEKAWGNTRPKRLGIVASNGRNASAEEIDACFDFFEVRPLTLAEKGCAHERLKLEGSWEMVSYRISGQPVAQAPLSRLWFAGNQVIAREHRQSIASEYPLDVTKTPRQLLMTPHSEDVRRRSLRAVYAFEGEQLVLCFDTRPDAPPPSELETREGDGRMLARFRQVPAQSNDRLAPTPKTSSAVSLPLHPPAWSLPSGSPPPAIAPFDAKKAKEHQEAWAKHLGVLVEMTNSIGMKLLLIPPGEFDMGSTELEVAKLLEQATATNQPIWYIARLPHETPKHRVRITAPFWLGRHEVTRAQFRHFVGDRGYRTEAERDGKGGWGAGLAVARQDRRNRPRVVPRDEFDPLNVVVRRRWYNPWSGCVDS